MRRISRLFNTIVGIVSSFVAVGCSHVQKNEDIDTMKTEPQEQNQASPSGDTVVSNNTPEPLPQVDGPILPSVVVGTYGPVAVFDSPLDGVSVIPNSQQSAEQESDKPIVDDIEGKYETIEAHAVGITPNKDYRTIKLVVDRMDGVVIGSVGEIYIDGQLVKNGRFKIIDITGDKCFAITNAAMDQIKNAERFVIKIPLQEKPSGDTVVSSNTPEPLPQVDKKVGPPVYGPPPSDLLPLTPKLLKTSECDYEDNKTLDAKMITVGLLDGNLSVRLNVGKKDGIERGAIIGIDIYIDNQLFGNGCFKVARAFTSDCLIIDVVSGQLKQLEKAFKNADKIVVRIPAKPSKT